MTLADFDLILKIGNSIGVIGVLFLIVYGFMRGDIVPRPTVDRLIVLYEKQADHMALRVFDRLESNDKAVAKLFDAILVRIESSETQLLERLDIHGHTHPSP